MNRIVAAEPRDNYRLWIRYQDGIEGELDLSGLVGKGVFARWEDPAEFARVFIDPVTRTVTWPGDIDLCPDSLYMEITGEPI